MPSELLLDVGEYSILGAEFFGSFLLKSLPLWLNKPLLKELIKTGLKFTEGEREGAKPMP